MIYGAGLVDDNANVTLVNTGRIVSDLKGGQLSLFLGTSGNANSGTLEAIHGGELDLYPEGSTAAFTNTGTIEALAGSSVYLESDVNITNISRAVLTHGTWEAIGAKASLTIGKAFTYDGATVVLSGAGSVIEDGATTLEKELLGISTGGKLEVLGSRSYATTHAFAIGGTLQLAGTGTFRTSSLSARAGSLIEGGGTVATALLDDGAILADAGKLDFTGAVSGAGKAAIEKKAVLAFGAASSGAVAFGTGGGRLGLQDAAQFTGTIAKLGAGDTIDVAHLGAGTTFTYAANAQKTGGTLTLKNGSTTDKLTLIGSYVSSGFKLTTGGSGDTLVTYAAPAKEAPAAAPSHAPRSADLAQSLFEAALGGGAIQSASTSLHEATSFAALAAHALARHG